MRRAAVADLVLDELRQVPLEMADVRDVLAGEYAEAPDGAFGALCHHLDPDRDADRDVVVARFARVVALVDDRTADRIVGAGAGWAVLAGIARDDL
ncbi:hypothetical protein [Saccharopolyspora cebuensis]|uniref:hypothetical protein n=1 Tax=Saccharopolyspora cebuensis TaxID=418759 RepID=UPI0031EC5193